MSAPNILSAYRDLSCLINDTGRAAKLFYEQASCRMLIEDPNEVQRLILWMQDHTKIQRGTNLSCRRGDGEKTEHYYCPTEKPFFFVFNKRLMSIHIKGKDYPQAVVSCLGKSNQPIKALIAEINQKYTWVGKKDNTIEDVAVKVDGLLQLQRDFIVATMKILDAKKNHDFVALVAIEAELQAIVEKKHALFAGCDVIDQKGIEMSCERYILGVALMFSDL